LLKAAEIESGHCGGHVRLQVQDEKLPLAIQNSSAGEKTISAENSVCFWFVQTTRSPPRSTQVRGDGRHIGDVQSAETQSMRHHQPIIRTVDLDAGGIFGIGRDLAHAKMTAAL